MRNILFAVSIFTNVLLVAIYNYQLKPKGIDGVVQQAKNVDSLDYEITSMNNFERVYYNLDDSLYKDLWNEAFENEPEMAFLISCSYFFVSKEKRILKDIEISANQLEISYRRKFKVNDWSLK